MRLPRPYIPVSIRTVVAFRQWRELFGDVFNFKVEQHDLPWLLDDLFGFPHDVHLDHDPPLAARKKIRDKNGAVIGYSPAANDPDFLVYRTREDHRVKTYVLGEHGQYSDTVLIKRERKREKKAGKVRKYRWPKRKLKSRSFYAAITRGHGE